MKTVMDYVEYNTQICGYLRKTVLAESDYEKIKKDLSKRKFEENGYTGETLYLWLQYLVDIIVMGFYSAKVLKNAKIKLKVFSLYSRIIKRYPDFYDEPFVGSFAALSDCESLLNLKDQLENVIEGSYPHQTLVFCYKELIDGWGNQKIVDKLSDSILDSVFTRFINEYTDQSGLPCFFVSLCFLGLREKLNKRLGNIIHKNDGITPKRMKDYLDWITGKTSLELYYRTNREHDITDWCDRVREKTIISFSKRLNSIFEQA